MWAVCIACILIYVGTVAALRNQRARRLPIKHGMRSRDDYAKMTADTAHSILKDLTELEFPKFMGFAIIFALFKTYGIPSISSLLVATGELSSDETISKRAADTGVLLLDFAFNKPSSLRHRKAVARMNYLHGMYQKAGRISNADMLYTLSLFALEPVRWINEHEWRQFTEVELCAVGVYWKAMGDAMHITWEELPSSDASWRDGLAWLQEVREWSERYEQRCIVPNETNAKLANAYLDVLFLNVPKAWTTSLKKFVSVIVGERLRTAMMLPEPTSFYLRTIDILFKVRRFIMKHLALPRLEIMRKNYVSEFDPQTGKYIAKEYLSHPWYVKPTFGRRWGFRAWITWLAGRKLPGDDGNKYCPEGYSFLDVGPRSQKGRGEKNMEETLSELQVQGHGGCPFKLVG